MQAAVGNDSVQLMSDCVTGTEVFLLKEMMDFYLSLILKIKPGFSSSVLPLLFINMDHVMDVFFF